MWWTHQQSFTLVKRQPCVPVKRTVTASAPHHARRPCEPKRAPFRTLNLTAEERLANRVLSDGHGDTRSENEILIADIRALELALQKAKQFQHQQESEVSRLRSECDRWLSETYLLSEQLANLKRKYAKTSAASALANRNELEICNRVPPQSVANTGDLETTDFESDPAAESNKRRAA